MGPGVQSQTLRERKSPEGYFICAMMRKLVHVAFGVLRSGEPFNAVLHNAA